MISQPSITATTADLQLPQIINYLSSLAQETETMFTNIDFSNLNENLAGRINSSLTEHQSLEAYASSAKLKKVSDEMGSVLSALQEVISTDYVSNNDALYYMTKSEIANNYQTTEQIENRYYSKSEVESNFVKKSKMGSYATKTEYQQLQSQVDELSGTVKKLAERVKELGGG